MKTKLLFTILFVFLSMHIFSQDVWVQKPTFSGTARTNAVGFAIGGKGYIGTGDNTSDFWEYDTTSGVWSQKANFSYQRSSAVGFSIGTKGYIGTGYYNNTNNDYNDFYEYNPVSNNWTQKASLPGVARFEAFGFAVDINADGTTDRGYIGGGASWSATTNDMWEYNPNSNVWTLVANGVGGTNYANGLAFSIGAKAYIAIGSQNTFWEWDQGTGAWTAKVSYPGSGSMYLFGFAINGKGYMGGGRDMSNTTEVQDFWEYDPLTNQWTQRADFGGGGRAEAVGFAIGNRGYAGTGFVGNVDMQDFWQYSPLPLTTNIMTIGAAQENNMLIYPNPCIAFATIEIAPEVQLQNAEIKIVDLQGREEKCVTGITTRTIKMETSDLPNGLHFCKLISGDQTIAVKKIIVQ